MNLAEMVGLVQQMLGDTKQEKIARNEVIMLINMGQSIVGGVLTNIERERFMAIGTISGTDTDSEFALPDDLRHIIRAEVSLNNGRAIPIQRWPVDSLRAIFGNPITEPLRGSRHYMVELGGRSTSYTPGKSRIRLYPAPINVDLTTINYIKMHTDFKDVDIWDGTVDFLLGSTTGLADSGAPFASAGPVNLGPYTRNGVIDAWVGAEILMKTGASKGQRARVVNFTPVIPGSPNIYGSFDFTPAMGIAPAPGDQYQVSMVSIIPAQHHHLICYYAAALGAPKCGLDPDEFMSYFEDEMDRMRTKWINNVTANVPGQIPNAPRKSMVEG